MSHRRPRSRRPRNTTDALVLATAFPHASRAQQDRILFEIAVRRGVERALPVLREGLLRFVDQGNKALRDPAVREGLRGVLGPLFARVGCGELFDQVLDAAEAHHRDPTSEDPDEQDVPDDGPFEPHECGGFILGLRRRFHSAEQVAICEVTLHDLVDPEDVRVEDLGTDFARINVSLRQPGTVPTAHTALVPAWANILKPAAGENRVATSPVDVQIIHPGDHGVTHLTLLFAQSTAPALAVPVTRHTAPAARPDNVVPFEKSPRAKGPAAPPPSAG